MTLHDLIERAQRVSNVPELLALTTSTLDIMSTLGRPEHPKTTEMQFDLHIARRHIQSLDRALASDAEDTLPFQSTHAKDA